MATVTLNFTAAQSARIQQAANIYNERNDTTLTPKQFIVLACIKETVRNLIFDDTAEDAKIAAQPSLDSDLTGNA